MKLKTVTILLIGLLSAPGILLSQRQAGPGVPPSDRRMVWVGRDGSAEALPAPPRAYGLPRLSPDGSIIAIEIRDAKYDVYTYEIKSGALTRITAEGINRSPLWTVDGKRLAFSSSKPGPTNVYWKPLAGGEMERLTFSENPHGPQSFLPDGSVLSFYEIHTETGRDIWMLPMTGERKPSLFLKTPALEGGAVFSPDGHWIAYVSDDSGRFEIYLKPYPGPGERIQISKEGGAEPMWGKDSWELFYRNVGKVMVVKVMPGPPIGIGQPQLLFDKKFERSPGSRANFDVTPDGQRLLMVQLVEGK